MGIILEIFEWLCLLAVVGGILLAAAAGIWTGLMAKFDDKVDEEVERRLKNVRIVVHYNIGFDVFEDTLGYEKKMQIPARDIHQTRWRKRA